MKKGFLGKHASWVLAGFCLLCFSPVFALALPGPAHDAGTGTPGVETPLAVTSEALGTSALHGVPAPRHPLLERFPPEAGWGRERKFEIIADTIRGTFPEGEERAFYLAWTEWEAALAAETGASAE